ncbi:uncharacterized protein KY384_008078 [Bacidia gigantensis]|uniref:uncharacterized protein n=1 Tax=Bacidia gigantensis TaxID=2732470 RepID=UPI001D054BF2|nr:uncharacterized protein KY384_008078 [Bacidia gigantensis]KAG8526649.1 hypothetical protein KY384_008078 [Bacidia gigantensis]
MYNTLSTLLTFALVGTSLSSVLPVTGHHGTQAGPKKMLPIRSNDFSHGSGLARRDSEKFSDLDFQTQSQLIYGSPGENGQVLLANMTLYAPDGLQIVTMERFEPLTKSVDCNDDDGQMSLTFKSQDAFDYALKTWSTINDNDDKRFLLIANHDGCGPDDERQPYIVNKITEDKESLTTFLAAQPASWQDVAGTYDLDFGQAGSQSHENSRLKEKRFLGIGNFGPYNPTGTFPVNLGEPNQNTNIASSDSFKLDCTNCYVQGSFVITGHLAIKSWSLSDLSMDAAPSGFNANLGLQASVTASKALPIGYQKQLFNFPIPNAGIKIPGIFTLGATVSYDIGVNASVQGAAKFDFGLKATLPDSAKATLVLAGDAQSGASGFDGAVDPYFNVDEIDAGLTISVSSIPKITFGLDITKIGKADVGIGLSLPTLSATFDAGYNANGFCADDTTHTKTGINISTSATIAVDAEAELAFGSDESNDSPSWSKTLFSKTWPLPFTKCIGIVIPGLGGAGSSSLPPTISPTIISSSLLPTSPIPASAIPTGKPGKSVGNSLYFPTGAGGTGKYPVPTGSKPSGYSSKPSHALPSGISPSGASGFSSHSHRSTSAPSAGGGGGGYYIPSNGHESKPYPTHSKSGTTTKSRPSGSGGVAQPTTLTMRRRM